MLASDTDAMLFFDNKFIANSTALRAHVGESHLVGVFVDPTVRPPLAVRLCASVVVMHLLTFRVLDSCVVDYVLDIHGLGLPVSISLA
jgi:hypothetical protein